MPSSRKLDADTPAFVRRLFWDLPKSRLGVVRDADLIVGRVLAVGGWDSIRWLRRTMGDDRIETFLRQRRGGGLSPRQLRYWQLLLGLSAREVDAWIGAPAAKIWSERTHT
jgi:hypothetical protein